MLLIFAFFAGVTRAIFVVLCFVLLTLLKCSNYYFRKNGGMKLVWNVECWWMSSMDTDYKDKISASTLQLSTWDSHMSQNTKEARRMTRLKIRLVTEAKSGLWQSALRKYVDIRVSITAQTEFKCKHHLHAPSSLLILQRWAHLDFVEENLIFF